jgi:hypothetical protein
MRQIGQGKQVLAKFDWFFFSFFFVINYSIMLHMKRADQPRKAPRRPPKTKKSLRREKIPCSWLRGLIVDLEFLGSRGLFGWLESGVSSAVCVDWTISDRNREF